MRIAGPISEHPLSLKQQPFVQEYDVIVLGGGAAGLMCALTAGQRGRRVVVLDSSNKVGKKILMSGGGRCNFTNLHCSHEHYLSSNPHFCKSALSRYTQWDFIALVEKHRIAYHEKTQGQLFCDHSSKDILSMLIAECSAANVTIRTDCVTEAVEFDGNYALTTNLGMFHSESLVIATGGLSIPKMGASGFGYGIARQFGLDLLQTRAGLVPFTCSDYLHDLSGRLAGVSIPAKISAKKQSFTDDMLFTHRGLSGPAVLQVSNYWHPGETVTIDLLPSIDADTLLREIRNSQPKALLRTVLAQYLPKNLVLELQALWWQGLAERALAEMSDQDLAKITGRLKNWPVKPAGTEGYRTAEVTLGGVNTNCLSSKTMAAISQPNLYFIGEVLDVTGHLGGFNFQWAWSSGFVAGLNA